MLNVLKTHISKHAVAYALIPVVSIGWSIQQRDLDAYATLMKTTNRQVEDKLRYFQIGVEVSDESFERIRKSLAEVKEKNLHLEERTREVEAALAEHIKETENNLKEVAGFFALTWLALGSPGWLLLGCVLCASADMGK